LTAEASLLGEELLVELPLEVEMLGLAELRRGDEGEDEDEDEESKALLLLWFMLERSPTKNPWFLKSCCTWANT